MVTLVRENCISSRLLAILYDCGSFAAGVNTASIRYKDGRTLLK